MTLPWSMEAFLKANAHLIGDILFHGTSAARHRQIAAEDCLRASCIGDRKVSFTPDPGVALYWARLSAEADTQKGGGDGSGVVLAFSRSRLQSSYELEAFSDQIWGEGACDWEQEVACWEDVDLRTCPPLAALEVEPARPQIEEPAP